MSKLIENLKRLRIGYFTFLAKWNADTTKNIQQFPKENKEVIFQENINLWITHNVLPSLNHIHIFLSINTFYSLKKILFDSIFILSTNI